MSLDSEGRLAALDRATMNTIYCPRQNSLSCRGVGAGRRSFPNCFPVPFGAVPGAWRKRYRCVASCTSATAGLGAWCTRTRWAAPAGDASACLLGRRPAVSEGWAMTARAGGCSMSRASRRSSSCTPPSFRALVLPARAGPRASPRQRLRCLHATSSLPKRPMCPWRHSTRGHAHSDGGTKVRRLQHRRRVSGAPRRSRLPWPTCHRTPGAPAGPPRAAPNTRPGPAGPQKSGTAQRHPAPCFREYPLGAGGRQLASAPSPGRWVSTFNG